MGEEELPYILCTSIGLAQEKIKYYDYVLIVTFFTLCVSRASYLFLKISFGWILESEHSLNYRI